MNPPPKPNPSIQVLNLSFPRCGTMTLQSALNHLGYTCWHSTTFLADPQQCSRWLRAQDAKFLSLAPPLTREDWDALFAGYNAVSADPPACGFAEELLAAYPEAKVILVEREEEEWFESFAGTVVENLFRWDLHAVADLDPELIGPVRDMQWHWVKSWWKVKSEGEMRDKARGMYREHNRRVRELVREERLLVYRLGEGWEPICGFLGKEVPGVPFPVKNDRGQVRERNWFIRRRGMRIVARKLVYVVGPVCMGMLAWWWYRRYA